MSEVCFSTSVDRKNSIPHPLEGCMALDHLSSMILFSILAF